MISEYGDVSHPAITSFLGDVVQVGEQVILFFWNSSMPSGPAAVSLIGLSLNELEEAISLVFPVTPMQS